MKTSKKVFLRLAVFCALVVTFGTVATGQIPVTVTLYETGLGSLTNPLGGATIPSQMLADPGPGGLQLALTFTLAGAPALQTGDVRLLEPGGGTNEVFSDLIRFNPATNGTDYLVFYSGLTLGEPPDGDKADTGLPSQFYSNLIELSEIGAEGNNGVVYTPVAGQPGFDTTGTYAITYNIISDVPEPSVFALAGLGAAALLVFHRRR